MENYFPAINRVPVVSESDYSFRFWMKFKDALDGLRQRKIEQAFDSTGKFVGVIIRESPAKDRSTYRSSRNQSKATLTEADSQANAGAASEKRIERARDKVAAWPGAHDDRAVVISAGLIHGATLVPSLSGL